MALKTDAIVLQNLSLLYPGYQNILVGATRKVAEMLKFPKTEEGKKEKRNGRKERKKRN